MSWPSGKYQPPQAAAANVEDPADSETWSDYIPIAVHSIPLELNGRTGPQSPPISSGGATESHSDRDIQSLAIEIAELQQMMDRVGSNVAPPPRSLPAGLDAPNGQAELREHAEMLHHYYVSTLGSSDSGSPILGDTVVSPPRAAGLDDAALLRQHLSVAESVNVSLQKENAALAKLLAEHLPHLQGGQNHAPIEPTALDLPNSLKYSITANSKASGSQVEAVPYVHFATEDVNVLRHFVEQLDVDSLPVDFARAGIEDAASCLVAINLQLAKKLEQSAAVLANSDDSWKSAALTAQSQNLEQQRVIAELNRRVTELTQSFDQHSLHASQNLAKAQRDLLLSQNDIALLHAQKEAEFSSQLLELEAQLQQERAISRHSAAQAASLSDQHTATLAELDELRVANAAFREQLPSLQAQLSTAQRELELQSKNSAALITDSARASKLEADFSASLQHSKKLQEQLIANEAIVSAATAAKNEADRRALKSAQAFDALTVEFTLLKSDCIAKDSKISSLQDSSAMLKEAVLLLTQKNESLSESLRGTDMMNSDAVSIIDSLHAKERSMNEEKAALQMQVQDLQHRIQELQASQLKGGEEVEERVLQLQAQLEQILRSEAETRAALQQETANLATTLEMNSDAIAFIESLKQSLRNLEEVSIPDLKQRLQSEVDAETAKVVEITIERDNLRASCSKLQAELSDLQQSIQHASKSEEKSRLTIEELQAQIHDQKQASHAQSDALASALEEANASRDSLHSSLIAAKTILDQLQMTNESSRDYGSSLLEVLSGIEFEIASLHDLLQATSSTVGASTAATMQLQQLHQVEVHRLQSEIEAQRSKGTHLTIELAAIQAHLAEITAKYEDQMLQLQQDLDRVSLAEAAAKQSLSRDSDNLAVTMEMNNEAIRYIEALREQYRLLESHSEGLKSELQQESVASAERLRKCKEEHLIQLESIKYECSSKLESMSDEHRRTLDDMRRRYSEQITNMEAALRKSSAQQLDVQPMLSARQVASGDAEKPKVFLPPVSPPSTVQLRLGDVKKRLDSKLSELMNVQVPSSTKAVTEQQAANAKLLDALRSRMLDVGASRSAHRLPSLQHTNGEGSSAASAAILQSISSQLEVMGSSSLNREIHA